MLGARPTASSAWLPETLGAPSAQSSDAAMPLPSGSSAMQLAFRRTSTSSASRISLTACETSPSSRPTRRGPISITVTLPPKRRIICANSSPT